jgi:hypothetical protein
VPRIQIKGAEYPIGRIFGSIPGRCLLQPAGQGHGRPPWRLLSSAASIESENLNRLVGSYGRFVGFEELADLNEQRLIGRNLGTSPARRRVLPGTKPSKLRTKNYTFRVIVLLPI